MNILLITKVFYPSMGGMEKYAFIMANTFQNMGHNVVVLTEELSPSVDNYSFKVVRSNRILKEIYHYIRITDAYIISGFSLKYIPFALLNRRNIIVYHNSSFGNNWQSHIKLLIAKLPIPNTVNITVSDYVGKSLKLKHYKTIHNPYENDVFRLREKSDNRKGFVYVGRICSDKGVKLLINAYLEVLKRNPYHYDMTLDIIGDGPQKAELEAFIEREHPNSRITFKGILTGELLNKALNCHKFQVVPSVWGEAFGIVALEGMAAGCIEICSDSDGLQEAIGNNGYLFKKGDVNDLATQMELALNLTDAKRLNLQRNSLEWVKNFSMKSVCKNYLNILK